MKTGELKFAPKLLSTLDEVKSPINGLVKVELRQNIGIVFDVNGYTQSGGNATRVWDNTLNQVSGINSNFSKALVLGLGGGSVTHLLNKYFPKIKITGVEIDPIMIDLGKKYLNLNTEQLEVVVDDAWEYVTNTIHDYDLILVDVYLGGEVLEKFDSNKFILKIHKLTTKDGICIFNRVNLPENQERNKILFQKVVKYF